MNKLRRVQGPVLRSPSRRGEGGFTLLEMMIAMGILAVVMLMVYMSLHRTSDLYTANSKHAWIIHQARTALDEIAEDIRQGNRLNISPVVATTEGVESGASNRISFRKIAAPVAGAVTYNTYYTSYFWSLCDNTQTIADPANVGKGPYTLPGATWVDANNNTQIDEGRLIRTDPNPNASGLVYGAKIMCNYLKNNPDGFQVRETYRLVGGIRQYQLRITLVLVFTDNRNKVIEQTLETTVFLRNSQ